MPYFGHGWQPIYANAARRTEIIRFINTIGGQEVGEKLKRRRDHITVPNVLRTTLCKIIVHNIRDGCMYRSSSTCNAYDIYIYIN